MTEGIPSTPRPARGISASNVDSIPSIPTPSSPSQFDQAGGLQTGSTDGGNDEQGTPTPENNSPAKVEIQQQPEQTPAQPQEAVARREVTIQEADQARRRQEMQSVFDIAVNRKAAEAVKVKQAERSKVQSHALDFVSLRDQAAETGDRQYTQPTIKFDLNVMVTMQSGRYIPAGEHGGQIITSIQSRIKDTTTGQMVFVCTLDNNTQTTNIPVETVVRAYMGAAREDLVAACTNARGEKLASAQAVVRSHIEETVNEGRVPDEDAPTTQSPSEKREMNTTIEAAARELNLVTADAVRHLIQGSETLSADQKAELLLDTSGKNIMSADEVGHVLFQCDDAPKQLSTLNKQSSELKKALELKKTLRDKQQPGSPLHTVFASEALALEKDLATIETQIELLGNRPTSEDEMILIFQSIYKKGLPAAAGGKSLDQMIRDDDFDPLLKKIQEMAEKSGDPTLKSIAQLIGKGVKLGGIAMLAIVAMAVLRGGSGGN